MWFTLLLYGTSVLLFMFVFAIRGPVWISALKQFQREQKLRSENAASRECQKVTDEQHPRLAQQRMLQCERCGADRWVKETKKPTQRLGGHQPSHQWICAACTKKQRPGPPLVPTFAQNPEEKGPKELGPLPENFTTSVQPPEN